MQIQQWPLSRLKPYEKNPRKNADAVAAVAQSISDYGMRQPIVVDKDGVIVVGHTRWLAAQQLKLRTVPVHVAKDLTPEQAKAYRIADNKTGELAEWDIPALKVELGQLKDLGVDLQALGFSPEELGEIVGPSAIAGLTPADQVPPVPQKAVTKLGDTWLLGDHRLRCGDSTNAADVDALMQGEKADLISTDPPYLVDYTGERPKKKGRGGGGKDWSATYREIDIKDADGFFAGVFAQIVRVAAPHAAIYCWHAHKRAGAIEKAWEAAGILSHQQLVWVKPCAVLGRVYWHFRHEPCVMGWLKGSKPSHNGDHKFSSVWEVNWDDSVWELAWEGGKKRPVGNKHPTQKPVEIFARPMRKHTRPGGVCFEPFSGSGSQIIAGEQLQRKVRAMELEPVFCDVAVERWEAFTGKKAKRIPGTGEASGRRPSSVEAKDGMRGPRGKPCRRPGSRRSRNGRSSR